MIAPERGGWTDLLDEECYQPFRRHDWYRIIGIERFEVRCKLEVRWYVLCSKLNKEEILLKQLQSQGYEIFYPRYFMSNGKTGRLNLRSYFPGYLFVRLDLSSVSLSTFQWMPNAEGLVCFETRPAYVPDSLIEAIRKHVENLNLSRLQDVAQSKLSVEANQMQPSPENAFPAIFSADLTGGERVQELMRMLQW